MHFAVQLFEGYLRGYQDEAITNYCRIGTFQEGESIILKGGTNTDLCIVLEGRATATIVPNLAVPFNLGEFFGELSFIDNLPRSVRVIATSSVPTRIAFLSQEALVRIRNDKPVLGQAITRNIQLSLVRHIRKRTKLFMA